MHEVRECKLWERACARMVAILATYLHWLSQQTRFRAQARSHKLI
jgi:hypothetical protein